LKEKNEVILDITPNFFWNFSRKTKQYLFKQTPFFPSDGEVTEPIGVALGISVLYGHSTHIPYQLSFAHRVIDGRIDDKADS